MKFKKEGNKRMKKILIVVVLSFIILSSGMLIADNSTTINFTITDAITQIDEIINTTLENIIEVSSKIEIWTDTIFNLTLKKNSAEVVLSLDNGTALPNQEIEFYLDESLISSQLTNSKGYTELIFNPNISPGNYSFRAEFQGNPNLYLNPSFAEEQIKIILDNKTNLSIPYFEILNQTLLNQTLLNQTIETNISLKGMVCKNFTDYVLFSSGYTQKRKSSTNYDIWEIQTNCTEAGGYNCSLHNINTKSRIIYANPYDDEITGEGYVQISELDSSDCNSPDKEKYSEYLAYDILKQEGGKWERYCGKTKIPGSECDSENSYNQQDESICYGIKTYASQYSIIDVVEIKYTWCWRQENE